MKSLFPRKVGLSKQEMAMLALPIEIKKYVTLLQEFKKLASDKDDERYKVPDEHTMDMTELLAECSGALAAAFRECQKEWSASRLAMIVDTTFNLKLEHAAACVATGQLITIKQHYMQGTIIEMMQQEYAKEMEELKRREEAKKRSDA